MLLLAATAAMPAVTAAAAPPQDGVTARPLLPSDFVPVATSAISPSDVWLVGNPQYGSDDQQATFEHWNGNRWRQVPIPQLQRSFVSDVLAVSSDDVWAVGTFGDDRILHWDGSVWSAVAIAGMPASAQLLSLSGEAADDVWAVGERNAGSRVRWYAVRFDGTSWTNVPTTRPPAHVYTRTRVVSVVDARDVWVTAFEYDAITQRGHNLLEHWDGERWTEVAGTHGKRHFDVVGVTAISATDVWANSTGSSRSGHGASLFHWDGISWRSVANSAPQSSVVLDALSSTDIWAVGEYYAGDKPTTYETFSMHWDGTTWTTFPLEGGRAPRDYMTDVSADRPDDVWACGYSAGLPILRHWDGTAWS